MPDPNTSQEKLKHEVHHMELAIATSQDDLARQGEELEALEKTYGVWESFQQNKLALVYSKALASLILKLLANYIQF